MHNTSLENKKQPFSKTDDLLSRFLNYLPFGCIFNTKPIIAILPLHGVIGSVSALKSGLVFDQLEEQIEKTFKIKKLQAVVLSINSPGGSPVQSELIYQRIRHLSVSKNIPVLAFVQDVAASGGYFLALAADEIFVSANSIIGSIGVISSSFGFPEVLKKLGIERRIYTQGKNKAVLDPFSPTKESDLAIITSIQQDIHDSFKALVRERRAGKLNADEDTLFNGEFWSGKKSLELGLVDQIGDMHNIIEKRYGEDVKYVRMIKDKSWLKRKLGLCLGETIGDTFTSTLAKVNEQAIWGRFGL